MIQRKDLLSFIFYEKEKFTGSFQGMRYLIQKAEEGEKTIFSVIIWPGPYNFETTPEEKRIQRSFPFTEEALEEITAYLNKAYEDGREGWPLGIQI